MASPSCRTRNKQLVRVLRLLALLQTGRHDLVALSRALAVSPRTVRRDLAAIEEAHLPIVKHEDCDDRISRWSLNHAH